MTWKKDGTKGQGEGKEGEAAGEEERSMRDKLKDKKVRCRICDGEHFTARCPFKDTMAPPGEDGGVGGEGAGGGSGGMGMGMDDQPKEGGLGMGGSSYVPPHLRKGAGASAGERMGGKYERDDLATLRVTNVCSLIYLSISAFQDAPVNTVTSRRSPSLQKSKISATYSSASAASLVFSSPRTERPNEPKALHSSVFKNVVMLPKHARRSMAVSSISPTQIPSPTIVPLTRTIRRLRPPHPPSRIRQASYLIRLQR